MNVRRKRFLGFWAGALLAGVTANLRGEPAPTDLKEPALIAKVQAVANESDGILRYQQTEELIDTLRERDYPVILNLMLLPEAETPGLIDLAAKVFRRWTESAPDRAAEWLRRLPDGTAFGREAYGVAGEAKARADASAAVAWLARLPRGGNQAAGQFAVAGVVAHQRPRDALALALALPPNSARDGLLGYCVLNWSATDFDGAATWVRDLRDPRLRERIASRLAVQEAVRNAVRAAQFAVSAMPPGEALNHTIAQVIHFWAAATPEAAAAWIVALPGGSLRETALEALTETWTRQDPARAQAWLREH